MEPFTLAVLGGAVAAEGVKFLYGQATELLTEWRARRAAPDGKVIEVPLASSSALDRPAVAPSADPALVQASQKDLIALSAGLSPYALGHADIDLQDERLAENTNALRLLLEGLYGVRLTFKGENRETTGTRLDIQQRLDAVHGSATGLEARKLSGGADASVRQEVREVGADGTVTGAKIDEIQ
ncbi:MAG: hypothetical protein ABW046_07620 [Actinoplanes sp.]